MYLVLDNLDRSLIRRQINVSVTHRYTLKYIFFWYLKHSTSINSCYILFLWDLWGNQPEEIPPGVYTSNTELTELKKNQITIPGFMRKECLHFYFCWDTFLLRDFLHIPNSPFPLLTTSLFPRITAGRQNSVWLESGLYRREVETNADNSWNSKSLFLAQCFGLSLMNLLSVNIQTIFHSQKNVWVFLCFSYFWDTAFTWLKALVMSTTLNLPNYLKIMKR